tara:strand:- start:370 stop:573 length:204 start_codon:yes stop_codon:yes gene_type:complete
MKKLLKYFKLGLWLIKKRNYYLDIEKESEEIREAYSQICCQNADLLKEVSELKAYMELKRMKPYSKR